jgi:uncharacterized protein YegJ (DUF2314 family)
MRHAPVLALWLLMATGFMPAAASDDDHVVMVSKNDPEMNAAIAKARASLGTFWQQYKSPSKGVSDFSLKVRIADSNGVEYFWLVDIKRNGTRYSGIINNDPEIVKSVRLDQRYSFAEADIADWLFMRNDKMVGNATARVLMKRVPPEEAKVYEGLFEKP